MSEVTSTEFQDEGKALQEPPKQAVQGGSKLNTNFYQRTRTTVYMILAFILILAAGQFYTAILVQLLNILIFSQINNIKRNEQKEVKIPLTKYINWYIFGLFNYYALGNFISTKLPYLGIEYSIIGNLLLFHNFICFALFLIGFLSFVLSLKQGFLKYQFRLFGWILVAVFLVCSQAWFMCSNIYQGMIWFIVPTVLIVVNDIFAYLFGYFFGKHPLIALSPKKTWEGYIGGAISTCLFSIVLTSGLQGIEGITCPTSQLSFMVFQYPKCTSMILDVIKLGPISISNLQAHCMLFSLFASIIGPFGGFFASGLKRSIKIKDFANLIPGHGGASDRMDCQLIMGAFVYFYYHSFIKIATISTSAYLLSLLSPNQQLQLFHQLKKSLELSGILPK